MAERNYENNQIQQKVNQAAENNGSKENEGKVTADKSNGRDAIKRKAIDAEIDDGSHGIKRKVNNACIFGNIETERKANDAENGNGRGEIERKEIHTESNGIERTVYQRHELHEFNFQFSLIDLYIKKHWVFQIEFKTASEYRPSSFLCKILFLKVQDDGMAWFFFELHRTDLSQHSVKVEAKLSISDYPDRACFFDPKVFADNIVPGGGVVRRAFKEYLEFPDNLNYNMRIYVQLNINVLNCHPLD